MKISRGHSVGQTGYYRFRETDSKRPKDYIRGWKYPWSYEENTLQVWLSGTINKQGKRRTDLHLEIDEADILAMSTALVERLRRSSKQARDDAKKLRTALHKINALIADHKAKFQTPDDLLQAVQSIAAFYCLRLNASGNPQLEQIKWKDI